MVGILMIFVWLAIGVVLRQLPIVPSNAYQKLNTVVLFISLPAVTLLHIPELALSTQLLYPAAVAWIVYPVALALFIGLGRVFGWDKATIGCLTLCCGLCNSSFIGYPLMEALYGKPGLEIAILVDQPGSFVVLSTLGVITAFYCSTGTPTIAAIAKKLFTFPPFLAFIVAFGLLLSGFHHTAFTKGILSPISATMVPLALVSVGLQLKPEWPGTDLRELLLGLSYKLLIAPLIIFTLYVLIAKQGGLASKVSIMEAATAPMVTGAILASQYNLRPRLANLFVGIGIPLSFATLAVWYFIVGR